MMTLLIGAGLLIWLFTIVMIVNYKKHPRLSAATLLIMVMTLVGIPTDIFWIVLVAMVIINGRRQKRLAA